MKLLCPRREHVTASGARPWLPSASVASTARYRADPLVGEPSEAVIGEDLAAALAQAVPRDVLRAAPHHCFAGCSPGDILSSIGLTFADQFPEPLRARATEQEFAPMRLRESAEQVLATADHDLLVAVMVLADFIETGRIEPDQLDVLISIAGKVATAKEVSCRCVPVVESCGEPRAN